MCFTCMLQWIRLLMVTLHGHALYCYSLSGACCEHMDGCKHGTFPPSCLICAMLPTASADEVLAALQVCQVPGDLDA